MISFFRQVFSDDDEGFRNYSLVIEDTGRRKTGSCINEPPDWPLFLSCHKPIVGFAWDGVHRLVAAAHSFHSFSS